MRVLCFHFSQKQKLPVKYCLASNQNGIGLTLISLRSQGGDLNQNGCPLHLVKPAVYILLLRAAG